MEPIVLGIIALTATLVKILDMVISAIIKKTFPESKFTEADHNRLARLYEMHNVLDDDGTPIWYVPRSWADTQKDILHTVGEVSRTQDKLADTMERFTQILDRIDRRSSSK